MTDGEMIDRCARAAYAARYMLDRPLDALGPDAMEEWGRVARAVLAEASQPVDLASLPHEDWCDLGGTHAECCPGKSERGCSCLTGEVVKRLRGERDE